MSVQAVPEVHTELIRCSHQRADRSCESDQCVEGGTRANISVDHVTVRYKSTESIMTDLPKLVVSRVFATHLMFFTLV